MNSQDPMIDNNDPRLTAYALGELASAEVAQIEAAIKSSPELQAVVADIRRASETISNVFISEPSLQLTPEQKSQLLAEAESASNFDVRSDNVRSVSRAAANVTPAVASEYYQPSSTSIAGWLKIAVAAGLACVLAGGAYYFSQTPRQSMTAADRAVPAAEPLVRNKEGSNENFDSPQPSLPTIAKELDDSESAKLAEADLFTPPTLIKSKQAKQLTKPSGEAAAEFAEADAKRDSKFEPRSVLPPARQSRAAAATSGFPNRTRAAAKSDFAAKSKGVADSKPNAAESLSAASNAMKLETESNSNTLTLAQRALEQSGLGSLNLTIVAQS